MPHSAALSLNSKRTLTVREAAFITGVAHTRINHMIDEGFLPSKVLLKKNNDRRLRVIACPMIRFCAETSDMLTKQARIWAFDTFLSVKISQCRSFHFTKGNLSIDLTEAFTETMARFDELCRAEDEVVCDPDIRGGMPVLCDTRIGVYEAAALARASSIDDALETYPSLTAERIKQALIYADAHPRPGRPRKKRPSPPVPNSKLRSSSKVMIDDRS